MYDHTRLCKGIRHNMSMIMKMHHPGNIEFRSNFLSCIIWQCIRSGTRVPHCWLLCEDRPFQIASHGLVVFLTATREKIISKGIRMDKRADITITSGVTCKQGRSIRNISFSWGKIIKGVRMTPLKQGCWEDRCIHPYLTLRITIQLNIRTACSRQCWDVSDT